MPAAQLLSSAIERGINQLLNLDPASQQGLRPLAGKQLQVRLAELPWPLVFAFSDRVLVLVPEQDGQQQVDCQIALTLQTLQALQDTSQLTQLIKQNRLSLDGELQVAQDFSALLKNLQIDWEEQLSHYTGDVIAHSIFNAGKHLFGTARTAAQQLVTTLSEGAIEEKRLAAHPYAVEDFCQQVTELRSDTERLEARLAALEKA